MNNWNPYQIREKLALEAKRLNLRMPQVQLLLCQERFLSRLMQIKEGKYFIWKGGSLILRKYQALKTPRFTVDLDFLAKGIDIKATELIFKKAVSINLEDGFEFGGIESVPMKRKTPYGGDRYEIYWKLFGKGQSESLKIDVCAGDDVEVIRLPSDQIFLIPENKQNLTLSIYPAEFIFAEKLETAVRFSTGNTRLKDYIDLWTLIDRGLDDKILINAIIRCFERRRRKFSLDDINKIFSNKEFSQIMEEAKERNYKKLQLPPMIKIFEKIKNYLDYTAMGFSNKTKNER